MQNFYLLTTNALTFYANGRPYSLTSDHPKWTEVVDLVTGGEPSVAATKLSAAPDVHALIKQANLQNTSLQIKGNTVYYDGVPQPEAASKYVIDILTNQWPVEPVVNFFARLAANPSRRSREMALESVVVNKFPISPDGRFMAYKRVRDDFKDCHSGTKDNSVGKIVSMPRHEVDDNPNRTCSTGLHACAKSYLRSFGGQKLIAVAIDPADVVCIPNDYNNTKMRVCKYEVMYELPLELVSGDREAWESPVLADDYLASPQKVSLSSKKYVFVLVSPDEVDGVTYIGDREDLYAMEEHSTQDGAIDERDHHSYCTGEVMKILLCRKTPKGNLKPVTVIA